MTPKPSSEAKDFLVIKIERPPKYKDVHDEQMLDDFLNNPFAWKFEILKKKENP